MLTILFCLPESEQNRIVSTIFHVFYVIYLHITMNAYYSGLFRLRTPKCLPYKRKAISVVGVIINMACMGPAMFGRQMKTT